MVAKISCGASLYGALAYNHDKLVAGNARIISGNKIMGNLGGDPAEAMRQTLFAFEGYVDHPHSRCSKPVVHISLNPDPKDKLADEQYAALAKDYLEKMGFGDQPYIIYKHEDIDRHHIHIVTSRVRSDGTRISDSNEHRRSMDVCRELERRYGLKQIGDKVTEAERPYLKPVDYRKGDVKRQVSNTLKAALTGYKFQSFGEWSALLSCFNIEAKPVRGEFGGQPYNGVIYTATDDKGMPVGNPYKSSLFGKAFGAEGLKTRMEKINESFRAGQFVPKIKAQVQQAMQGCGGDRAKFEKLLGRQGIDVVLRKNDEGRIYGVTFIDHNNKEVYNGSRLGKEFSANTFQQLFSGQAMSQLQAPGHSADQDALRQDYGSNPSVGDEGSAHGFLITGLDFEQHGRDYQDEMYARKLRKKKKRKKKPAF